MSRTVFIDSEIILAIECLEAGFAILQNDRTLRQRDFVCFRLLSDGLERYMKVALQIHRIENDGEPPKGKSLKKISHDLEELTVHVIDEGVTESLKERPDVAEALEFVKYDVILNCALGHLSHFANLAGRYHFLEGIKDPGEAGPSFVDMWDQLLEVVRHQLGLGYSDNATELQRAVVPRLEKLLRFVSMSIRWRDLSPEMKRDSTKMGHFLFKGGTDVGERKYPVFRD